MQKASEQASYTQSTMPTPVKADDLDPDERFCSICLQPFGSTALNQGGSEAPTQLPCGHVFGEVCMASWARLNNSCPLCRRQAFSSGIGEHSAGQYSPDSQVSTPLSSTFSPQVDIWLDEDVWNTSDDSREYTVSYIDTETLILDDAHDHSEVNLGFQHRRLRGALNCGCGEHHDFCQCTVDQNTRNAALSHRRLTTPATAPMEPPSIGNLDLVQLGSQFAELNYEFKAWMDDFSTNRVFGPNSLLDHSVEGLFPYVAGVTSSLSERVRHMRN